MLNFQKQKTGRKAQVWYADFTIGLLLFLIVLVVYFEYFHNLSVEDDDELNGMMIDLRSISSSLVTTGYPFDWNSSSVEKIGLTDGNTRLNQTKLESFYALNHSFMINRFNTRYNFNFYLEDGNKNIIEVSGKEYAGIEDTSSTTRLQVSRLAIYNSSIVKMVMSLWV